MSDYSKLEELKSYDKAWCVGFAIWCARKVLPIWETRHPEDKHPVQAIQAAQNWLDNPTEENKELALTAANAAYYAGAAYYAAWAVAYADDAAWHAARALNDGRTCLNLYEEYKRSLDLNTISLQELNAGL